MVTLVRVAQRLGGDGTRLLLQPETTWTTDRDRDALAALLASLADLSRVFDVVLALDGVDLSSVRVAAWCAARVPGVTVVAGPRGLGAAYDDVLARGAGGAGCHARWRLIRQSDLVGAGA